MRIDDVTAVPGASYPRWTVMTKRRRLTLRGARPRFERALLTLQTNPIDVGAWLDEYHRNGRARGRLAPYVLLEQFADGIAPITVSDPTPLINFSREAHHPKTAFLLARA